MILNLNCLKIHFPKILYLCNGTVHRLFIDFKKAYDSVKGEVLLNILLEFGISKKQGRLIKMCLNETYSKVRVGKLLSDKLTIQNGLR
jgi:hypothetical protein